MCYSCDQWERFNSAFGQSELVFDSGLSYRDKIVISLKSDLRSIIFRMKRYESVHGSLPGEYTTDGAMFVSKMGYLQKLAGFYPTLKFLNSTMSEFKVLVSNE